MTTRKAEPHKVFLDHITALLRNLLLNNPNFKNYHLVELAAVKERVQHILDEIEKTKHLIEPWTEEKTNGQPVAMDDEDTTKTLA